MKVIFLDIDGVLNSQLFYEKKSQDDRCEEKAEIHFYEKMIDKDAVELLNKMVAETGAKVVISSTWRKGKNIEWLQNVLKSRGFRHEVLDKTPVLWLSKNCESNITVPRGVEIMAWLKDHPEVKRYVIFDDDSDMLFWQKENYFRVDGYCGLTPNLVYRATRYLNN